MREVAALCVLGIAEQRSAGSMGQRQVFSLPGLEAGCAQQLQQLALTQSRIKLPVRAWRQGAGHSAAVLEGEQVLLKALGHARAVDHFAGANACQPFAQFILLAFRHVDAALRDAHPGQTAALTSCRVQG